MVQRLRADLLQHEIPFREVLTAMGVGFLNSVEHADKFALPHERDLAAMLSLELLLMVGHIGRKVDVDLMLDVLQIGHAALLPWCATPNYRQDPCVNPQFWGCAICHGLRCLPAQIAQIGGLFSGVVDGPPQRWAVPAYAVIDWPAGPAKLPSLITSARPARSRAFQRLGQRSRCSVPIRKDASAMTGRFHTELPGRSKPDPEPGGPLGVAEQVEMVAVELLDHLASDTCVCDQAKACGLCLLGVVKDNDYAQAHAAWTAAALSLGIANFGPDRGGDFLPSTLRGGVGGPAPAALSVSRSQPGPPWPGSITTAPARGIRSCMRICCS